MPRPTRVAPAPRAVVVRSRRARACDARATCLLTATALTAGALVACAPARMPDLAPGAAPVAPPLAGKRVEARRGVVVSSAADASAAGRTILAQGGNAVDAAVATAFALGVVDPSQTGLGGYAVGTVWLAGPRQALVLEAMGQAGADPAWGASDPTPAAPTSFEGGDGRAPRTALVPGFVRGLLELHERHGRLSRQAVLAPAVALARDGFVVGPLTHRLIVASRDKLAADSAAARLFLPDGEPLGPGDRLVQPALARLLVRLQQEGAAGMYEGPVAAAIARTVRAAGGLLDSADFARYRPAFRRPVCSTFRGYTVLGAPAPVSGPTMAELLQVAEQGGALALGDPTQVPAAAVRWADVLRVGVADRRLYAGHPEWAATPVRGVASAAFARDRATLVGGPWRDAPPPGDAWAHEHSPLPAACQALDPYPAPPRPAARGAGSTDTPDHEIRESARAAARDAARLHDAQANGAGPNDTGPNGAGTDGAGTDGVAEDAADAARARSETSHLVVVDAEHNVVSLTSSVGVLFGSGVWAEGVFLNSSGNLFARGDRAPGRRPSSGLVPTILLDGRGQARLAAGAGGAAYIPTAVAQAILRIAGLGQDPYVALASPRLHVAASGRTLELEQGFALDVYEALRARGWRPVHRVGMLQFAGVHAAWIRDDGTIVGAADPRRDGVALGW